MSSVQIYQYFVIDIDDNNECKGGSLTEARSITLGDGEVFDQTFKVGTGAIVKVWDKTENEALGNFDFLWMESDFDVLVQFTTDAGTSDAYDIKELKGSGTSGTMGPALILGSDDTLTLSGTIDLFTGTDDTIDEIWIHNDSTENVARVRVVIAT